MHIPVTVIVIYLLILVYFIIVAHKAESKVRELKKELPPERLRKSKGYEILLNAYERYEPTFTIRAKDVVAQQAMAEYCRNAKILYTNNPDHPFIKEVEEIYDEFVAYERRNKNATDESYKVRIPD